jgi:hypothetical protein
VAKKPYSLKIVLGKRSYRKGPTESTMSKKLGIKKKKPTAEQIRIKQIGRKLGS